MFDSVTLSEVPPNPPAVACYVNGMFANHAEALHRFPNAHILTIAVNAGADADVLDIETYDATPADAPGWYRRQKARGLARPCLYASASVMESGVLPVLRTAGIPRTAVRLWSAHYTWSAHICSSTTCGAMSTDADGTQFTDRALGRNLDESLLLADFFAATPPLPPPDWQAVMMSKLPTLQLGAADTAGHPLFVRRVQLLVSGVGEWNNLGPVTALRTDGAYGPATAEGVKRVQQFLGITQDGICGNATWAGLITGSAR